MIADETIAKTIAQCRLDTDLEHAREVAREAVEPLKSMDVADRNTALLLLERFVLGSQGGHTVTVKFGHSDAVNNPVCVVCRRAVTLDDWSLRVISQWENSQLWLTWHAHCVEGAELELDVDLLDGSITSPVGFV